MQGCVFCRIVRKEAAASWVYEDEHVAAFLDINPIARGHALVVPKQHFRDVFDIDQDSLQRTASVAMLLSRAMKKTLAAEGVNLINASGAAAEQSIFHFHIHVVPRWRGDETSFWEWWSSKAKVVSREELDQLSAKIMPGMP